MNSTYFSTPYRANKPYSNGWIYYRSYAQELNLIKENTLQERSLGRRHCHPMGLRKRKAGIRFLVDYFDIL